jgi:hypothetical protein
MVPHQRVTSHNQFCIEKITDISKYISSEWRKLTTEEKFVWEEKSNQDKKRFLVEKQNYSGPWQVHAKHDTHSVGHNSSLFNPSNNALMSDYVENQRKPSCYEISDLEKEAAENLMYLLRNK